MTDQVTVIGIVINMFRLVDPRRILFASTVGGHEARPYVMSYIEHEGEARHTKAGEGLSLPAPA